MSIESRGSSESNERVEFIHHLERAHQEYQNFYAAISNLRTINKEAIQNLLAGIERLLIAEETKIMYPEQYNPKPEEARLFFEKALTLLDFK